MAKDNKLSYCTYQVSYKAIVDVDDKIPDTHIESFNKRLSVYAHKIQRHSEFCHDKAVCFAAVTTQLRQITYVLGCDINLNIDINVLKGTTDTPYPNRTFFDLDFIQSYLSYLKNLFNYEFNVIANEDNFVIHVEYKACSGNIICLLSFIRYLYEWPYQTMLRIASAYIKEFEQYKDYFMYIIHKLIIRHTMALGHTPYSGLDPRMYTDADLRSWICKNNYTTGYSIFSSSGIETDSMPAKLSKNKHDICASLEDVLDGTAYIQIKPLIHNFFIKK